MRICLLVITFFVLNLPCIFAQDNITTNVLVKGQIIDSLTNETIPYATIKITEKGNPKALMKAVAADDNGKFQISMNKKGEYNLIAEYIGKKTVTEVITIDNTKTLDLGTIIMPDNAQALSEIVVSAQKPLVKVDLDKITYSIEDDPESKTNNVLDMLKKVPMITVDGDENIQLKGSSNYKIYLNGKPSNMISSNPKDVLRGMPANTVKDIQVITDPGAKYDAEGVAGIINIVTQSNTSMGGYTATLSGRADNQSSGGGGVYLSLKYGKIGFTGNYNYNKYKRPESTQYSFRENLINDNYKYLHQTGLAKNTFHGQFGSGEFSYEIDTLNLINIGFNRFHGNRKADLNSIEEMQNLANTTIYGYDRDTESKGTFGGTDVNMDYQRTFKKKDQLLTASYKYSYNPNDSESESYISHQQGKIPRDAVTNRQYSDANMQEHTFQMDFVTPFSKIHSLETGMKYIIRLNESNSGYDTLNTSGKWDNIQRTSDEFKHKQDILAGYGGYSAKFNKWGIKTGLRYEATWLNAEFPLFPKQDFNVNYSNVVPSATLTYQLTPMQNIRMGYNMRISRPGIYQLNPYLDSSDPNNLRQGNYNLDAVKSHSISANYGFFNPSFNMNMNLAYSFENNGIESIKTMLDNISYTTYENIGKRKNLGLSAYVNWSITEKLRIYSNMSGEYMDIKANNNENLSNNGFSGNIFFGGQYTLPWTIRMNLATGFFSSRVNLQGENSSFAFHAFSFNKAFPVRKINELNVRVYCDNPFTKEREFNSWERTNDLYSTSRFTNPMRRFGISLTFRFGEMKSQIKKTQRKISNDDVMSGGQDSGGGGQGGQN